MSRFKIYDFKSPARMQCISLSISNIFVYLVSQNLVKAERAKVEDFILNPKQNDRRKCSYMDGSKGCSSRYYQGRW